MSPNPLKAPILFYSQDGNTCNLARQIARGTKSVGSYKTVPRTVPKVSIVCGAVERVVPDGDAPYTTAEDLKNCVGLALGSPARFGNMTAVVKYFIDGAAPLWFGVEFVGKPAIVSTNTPSLHDGRGSTPLTMMLPPLHRSIVINDIPYTEPALSSTQSGDMPYGASHVSGHGSKSALTAEEDNIAFAQGKHLTELTRKLAD